MADFFSSPGGGLDALAFAVAQQQASTSTSSAAGSSSTSTFDQHPPPPAGQHSTAGPAGTEGYSHMDGVEAASVLGSMMGSSSSRPPPPPIPYPHLYPDEEAPSTAPPSLLPPSDNNAKSEPREDGFDDDELIPAEALDWDDTIGAATRVKLAHRRPTSSPVKAHPPPPSKSQPAKKKTAAKKPTSTSAKTGAAAGAKARPKGGKKEAVASPAAPTSGVESKVDPSAGKIQQAGPTSTAAEVKHEESAKVSQKGKFSGLGRSWRKGLAISGDKLKTMTREEIEQLATDWTPPAGLSSNGNATASGSGSAPSSSKAPTKGKSTKAGSNAAASRKLKTTSKAGTSSTVPAKRKATSSKVDDSKAKKGKTASKKSTLSAIARTGTSPSPGPSQNRSRSGTVDRPSQSVEPTADEDKAVDSDEDEDDQLYCLCQEKYDEEKIMMACDLCEDWYHPVCVGLPEDRVNLVGQFICPRCMEVTDERTTWKTKCLTEGCYRSAVPGLTKYCSTSCGETHLANMLESASLPRRHFEHYTSDAQPPAGVVKPNSLFPGGQTLESTTSSTDKAALDIQATSAPHTRTTDRASDLRRSIAEVETHLTLLGHRLVLLALATRRADVIQLDALSGPTVDEHQEELYNPRKKKSKFDGGPNANRVCGFDVRLVFGEVEWAEWVQSEEGKRTLEAPHRESALADREGREEEDGVSVEEEHVKEYMRGSDDIWCARSKKRCDAHSQWQKVRMDDFALEQSAQQAKLASLREILAATDKEVEQVEQRAAKKRQQEAGPAAADDKVNSTEESVMTDAVGDVATINPTSDTSAVDVQMKEEPSENAPPVQDTMALDPPSEDAGAPTPRDDDQPPEPSNGDLESTTAEPAEAVEKSVDSPSQIEKTTEKEQEGRTEGAAHEGGQHVAETPSATVTVA